MMRKMLLSSVALWVAAGCATSGRAADSSSPMQANDSSPLSRTDRVCDLVAPPDVDNRLFNSTARDKLLSGEEVNCPTMVMITHGGGAGSGRLH